ncbi:MAG: OsmC family protein [SAR324 cluster bacterium]|nr:OsmC family protein [SAR324 cluster bacterium]
MAARGIELAPRELVASVEGDIEKAERSMKITEIRVHTGLPLEKEQRDTADRVLEVHPAGCPAHQSVKDAIRITIDAQYDFR